MSVLPTSQTPSEGGIGVPSWSGKALTAIFRLLHPQRHHLFSEISALTRLSHKYQLPSLLESCVAHLKRALPTTFNKFNDVECSFGVPCRPSNEELFEAINLLRLVGRTDLLPYAFYRLASLDGSAKAILRGGKRADGTLEHLSHDDLERCLSASHELTQATLYIAAELVTSVPSAECADRAGCAQHPAAERRSILDNLDIHAQPHPLGCYYPLRIAGLLEDQLLCAACAAAMSKRLSQLQGEVWQSLPEYFELSADNWNLQT